MQVKHIGLTATILITVAIIGFKTHQAAATPAVNHHSTTPRVLLFANLAEANDKGDACATMIHLVRAAHARGLAAQEVGANSKSPLLARYHVLVIPTVLFLNRQGQVVSRLEGEGGNVVKKLRAKLAQLK